MENRDKSLFNELAKMYFDETGNRLPEAKRYASGKELYSEGQVPKGIYYVKNGTVKISHNNHEKPVVVRLVGKDEFIGYVSLIKHWDYTTTAIAIEPSEIYFIPKEFFLAAIDENMKFVNVVLDILCRHIDNNNNLLTDMLTKSVQERLAIVLLTLDRDPTDGKLVFMKKDIASILNIKAETLSRNLMQLQKKGLIKLHNKTNAIEILGRERLLKLTQITD